MAGERAPQEGVSVALQDLTPRFSAKPLNLLDALVFSDNAPVLEAKLHNHFNDVRLNKANGRKEFFRTNIREIEAVIRENYDAVVEVISDAPAGQYWETLRMGEM